MARNFGSRVTSPTTKGIIFFLVGAVQAFEYIMMSSAFFTAHLANVAPNPATANVPANHPLVRSGTTGTAVP